MAGSREGLVRSEFIFISQCVAAVHDKVVCFVLFPKDLFFLITTQIVKYVYLYHGFEMLQIL